MSDLVGWEPLDHGWGAGGVMARRCGGVMSPNPTEGSPPPQPAWEHESGEAIRPTRVTVVTN
ncbi:MAG: hypothetical protein KDA27_22650 [Candidatus Eisenbacteria bacterium]|uniref:Uncharacterized protein n=1 Tax=Eiseniibacteriota bacterium TaxID=2212470 RepID=A0A956SGH7_UNCEI|nr:hypothetical protein [Candidatus Eisenbacteria bacterium]